MSDASSPRGKLYINKVLHKAFVEVSEKGTEAAAATAVAMMTPMSLPMTTPFTPTFKADRPFVYLIRDRVSGSILFMGRMMNPSVETRRSPKGGMRKSANIAVAVGLVLVSAILNRMRGPIRTPREGERRSRRRKLSDSETERLSDAKDDDGFVPLLETGGGRGLETKDESDGQRHPRRPLRLRRKGEHPAGDLREEGTGGEFEGIRVDRGRVREWIIPEPARPDLGTARGRGSSTSFIQCHRALVMALTRPDCLLPGFTEQVLQAIGVFS